MILTTEQIREILKLMRLHHYAFVYTNVTKEIDPDIINQLEKEGIIQPGQITKEYFKDTYEIERFRDLIESAKKNNITYAEAKNKLLQNPIQLTTFEQDTIEHIEQSAGQYITKQADVLSEKFEEGVRNENMKFKQEVMSGSLKTPLKQGVAKRQTMTQIVSELRKTSEDTFRDFYRVAFTEMQNARMHSKIDQIYRQNEGKEEQDIMVYKRPNPDACPKCKSAYLEKDGITPKVFPLSEFKKHVTNFGVKSKKWMPTLESLHPYCACEMHQLQPGFGFDEKGQLKFLGKSPKTKKPEPVSKNLHLYDSNGKLKKSKTLEALKKSQNFCDIIKVAKKLGKETITVKEIMLIKERLEKEGKQ